MPLVAWGQPGLEKDLQLRLALGEFGEPPCAPISNLRPAEQGFDDIRFEGVPGAHRIVVVPSSSGWRMAFGVPELTVFTAAGFYTMRETTFTAPDGEKRPAREFRLTPKGFLAMAPARQDCYPFVSFAKIELASSEPVAVPERLSGLGRAYRARMRIHYTDYFPWARTPEFRYVFTKILNAARDVAGPVSREQIVFLYNGRWYSEREAMMALAIDAAALRPETRGQAQAMQEKMASETPERRVARQSMLKTETLREQLAQERYRSQLQPCLELPAQQADLTGGIWKKDVPPTFVLYEQPERRDTSRYDHAFDVLRRLERAGLAKSEPFEGEPFAGARAGKGMRFVLGDSAAASLRAPRQSCLPLGDAKIEELQIGPLAPAQQYTMFRGWARLMQPRPWTEALARQFPNVRAIVDGGFGLTGIIPTSDAAAIQLQLAMPAFGRKAPPRAVRLEPLAQSTGPAVVDIQPGMPVRMVGGGCSVSADGTEVVASAPGCTQMRASRAFRSGKAYAEIIFRGKGKGAQPETWTNAAMTTPRSLSSVSTGAASFSFAGSFNKHQIRDGDVISLAMDLDSRVLYWRLNGEWMTGRPGTGLGEPLQEMSAEYFIAVSVQDKAEAWRINFGATPFRFPAPDGFPAYATRE